MVLASFEMHGVGIHPWDQMAYKEKTQEEQTVLLVILAPEEMGLHLLELDLWVVDLKTVAAFFASCVQGTVLAVLHNSDRNLT